MDTSMLWALVAIEGATENWHVWNDWVAENRHDRNKKHIAVERSMENGQSANLAVTASSRLEKKKKSKVEP